MLSLKNVINEPSNYQDKEYLEAKNHLISSYYEGFTHWMKIYPTSLSIIDLLFYRKILPSPSPRERSNDDLNSLMGSPVSIIPAMITLSLSALSKEMKDKLYSYNLSQELEQDRELFYSYLCELSGYMKTMSEYLLNELNRVLESSITYEDNPDKFMEALEISEPLTNIFLNKLFYANDAIYIQNDYFKNSFYKWDLEKTLSSTTDYETLNKDTLYLMRFYAKYIDEQFEDILTSLGTIFAYRKRKMILKDHWQSVLQPILSYIKIHNKLGSNREYIIMEYMSQYNYNEMLSLILKDVLEIISFLLGKNINITLEELKSIDEYNKLSKLWNIALEKVMEWPNVTILSQISYSKFLEKHKLSNQEILPTGSGKAANAIQNFLSSNAGTIIIKLKDSGLQLSAAALQNDENISRVAGVIHNLLPTAIRFFVSYNTVENFLLNNRQWLINKLT